MRRLFPLLLGVCFYTTALWADEAPEVVRVSQAVLKTFSQQTKTVGTIFSQKIVVLKAETDGILKKLTLRDGSTVKKGELLVELNNEEQQAALAKADADLKLALANLKRQETLMKHNFARRATVDEVRAKVKISEASKQAAKAALHDTMIYSPFEGVASNVKLTEGAYVQKGEEIMTLVDLKHFRVEFFIPEQELAFIQKGQTIDVTTDILGEVPRQATVYAIDPKVNDKNHSIRLLAEFKDTSGKLASGIFCRVHIPLSKTKQYLAIPEKAIRFNQHTAYVYRVNNGKVKMVEIKPILSQNGLTALDNDTLHPNDTIVVQGQEKLFDGSAITVSDK